VRPGIVAGPFDPTERFTYWVRRCSEGGVVVAPARPDQPVQVVHGRDLGDFVVKATVDGVDGPFNGVGPSSPLTFAGMIEACAEAAGVGGSIEVEWVDEEWAGEREFRVPMHIPAGAGVDGLFRASSAKAEAAGLVNRSIVETAADTLAWDQSRGVESPLKGTPSAEQEAALVEEWRRR